MVRNELGLKRRKSATGLAGALSAVSEEVRIALHHANEAYSKLGVRYALCGGLAAGAYGEPRATKDVDFLVGDEAFVRSGPIVSFAKPMPLQAGRVAIDPIPLPENEQRKAFLNAALDSCEIDSATGVPMLSAIALAFMKLASPRLKDRVDVAAMLQTRAVTQEGLEGAIGDDAEMRARLQDAIEEASRED